MTHADASAARTRRLGWLMVALLLLAALRMGWLVLHDPLIGVANNYDMIRVQACIDAYPDRPADIPPGSNSYIAPLPHYRFIHDVGAPCFLTSEAVFAAAAWPAMKLWSAASDQGHFPLRLVGVLKVTALWLLAVWFSWAWWRDRRAGWAAGNALIAAVVLADPGVTVFANTFYAEFAAVYFSYGALAAIALVWTRGRVGALGAVVIALLLALAILSKIQHVVLGVFVLGMVAALALGGQRMPRRLAPALLLATLAATSLQLWHMQSPQTLSIRHANQTNTFLYAALGLSADPHHTAAVLGLPAICAEHAGENWFTPGIQEQHPCPQVFDTSRLRLLTLAWRDPGTLVAIFATTLDRMHAWVVPLLGKVEGGRMAPLPASQPTLDPLLVHAPTTLFALWLLAPGVLAVLLVLRAGSAGAPWHPSPPAAFLLLALGGLPWLTLVVVAFGDGLADPAKQSHLGITAALAAWLVLAGVLVDKKTENQAITRSS